MRGGLQWSRNKKKNIIIEDHYHGACLILFEEGLRHNKKKGNQGTA